MSVTLKFDSITPQDVYDLTLAFQRTTGLGLPSQITTEPTVTVGGSAMGWVSPSLTLERSEAITRNYREIQDDREQFQANEVLRLQANEEHRVLAERETSIDRLQKSLGV